MKLVVPSGQAWTCSQMYHFHLGMCCCWACLIFYDLGNLTESIFLQEYIDKIVPWCSMAKQDQEHIKKIYNPPLKMVWPCFRTQGANLAGSPGASISIQNSLGKPKWPGIFVRKCSSFWIQTMDSKTDVWGEMRLFICFQEQVSIPLYRHTWFRLFI